MKELIIIQAAFAALCILEAFHDAAVISIQDYRLPHYAHASKLWHRYSAWYVAGVALMLAYVVDNVYLVPCLLTMRLIFFNPILNVIRGKQFYYLSDKGLDGFFSKLLGKYAGVFVWIGSIIYLILLNLFFL